MHFELILFVEVFFYYPLTFIGPSLWWSERIAGMGSVWGRVQAMVSGLPANLS